MKLFLCVIQVINRLAPPSIPSRSCVYWSKNGRKCVFHRFWKNTFLSFFVVFVRV